MNLIMMVVGVAILGSEPSNSVEAPALPEPMVLRVGGDLEVQVVRDGDTYQCGRAMIDTPLPAGYPAPTPPGAIEIKQYPAVRRAQVSSDGSPDWGMNFAFWPLFQHIKKRDIAMTSPVEMDYEGLSSERGDAPDAWTMSFLYRTAELGPTEKGKKVEVVDAPPVTVIAIGFQGSYRIERVRENLKTLELWLAKTEAWEVAGEARALFYNGPEQRSADKWGEVQLPVRGRAPRPVEAAVPAVPDEKSEATSEGEGR